MNDFQTPFFLLLKRANKWPESRSALSPAVFRGNEGLRITGAWTREESEEVPGRSVYSAEFGVIGKLLTESVEPGTGVLAGSGGGTFQRA